MKTILNKGELALLRTARQAVLPPGTEAFPKIRVADVIGIEQSGISSELYTYALKAHFDLLLVRDNRPRMAIEFDGAGHDSRNDSKKAALCERFELPLVRVTKNHVEALNFGDSAVSFLIHQLDCVDAFISSYGNDPYEPYDPAWFITIPGKDRHFPFAYADRWRARLAKRLKANADKFTGKLQEIYAAGLVNFGCIEASFVKGGKHFRSISGLKVRSDRVILGKAELEFEVHGLSARRFELFMELSSFVDGLAASEMFDRTVAFLDEVSDTSHPLSQLNALANRWLVEGYVLRRGLNWNVKS